MSQSTREHKDTELKEEDSTPIRRSKRDRKSTVMIVNGVPVLRENNYVVKGMTYQFGVFEESQTKKKRKVPQKTKFTGEKVPREVSEHEKQRIHGKSLVAENIRSKKKTRMAYLAHNLDTLMPFIEPKVKAELQSQDSSENLLKKKNINIQPDSITAEMRDYQLSGLEWMVNMHLQNLGMILGDEMGLGKTLQTLSLVCYLKERNMHGCPTLVVCPLSVLYSWCNEISKWAPSLKFLRFHSSCLQEREVQKENLVTKLHQYDIVVTTYEMIKVPSLKSLWRRLHFTYVVLDEGHIIKNRESQISEALRGLHFENTLILTGTPLQNNLVELWSLMNYLYPDILTSSEPFSDAFDISGNVFDNEMLLAAHKLLKLFMIRRLKDEVEKLMPPKIETKIICPLSKTQIFWYRNLLLKEINMLSTVSNNSEEVEDKNANTYQKLRTLVMQLRKCCNHPFLFDGVETIEENTTCEDLIAASGKLAVVDKLLISLYKKNHRVVLFSQFTTVLDIIEDYCNERGWIYCRLDGSTSRAQRNYIVNKFNKPGSRIFIFLMSTRSGGLGINLQTADTCILFDSDWNPQPDIQAMARVHRIGQKRTVHVYRLVTGETIEERILQRAEKKLYLDQMVNRGDGLNDEKSSSLSTGELLATLRFGCNAIFGENKSNVNKLPTNTEIDMITDRNRSENFSAGTLIGGITKTAKNFDVAESLKPTKSFNGVDFQIIKDNIMKKNRDKIPSGLKAIKDSWKNYVRNDKRERKSRLLTLNGRGSGYGSAVPVLASNNYDLLNGETSVFNRELKGRSGDYSITKKKRERKFGEQDFCQYCGQGGNMLVCPSCPICVHATCAGITTGIPHSFFRRCSHHRCCKCGKNRTEAGGILFPCQSCPDSFCEDCLPQGNGVRLLEKCDRFEALNYSNKKDCYIHCSKACEDIARNEFGWELPREEKHRCPTEIDVSYAFDGNIECIA